MNSATQLMRIVLRPVRPLALLLSLSAGISPAFGAQDAAKFIGQAQQALGQGDARSAEIAAKNALQIEPQSAEALLLLARAYLDLEQPLLALKELERADLMGAERGTVLVYEAHAYMQQQDFKRVLDKIENDESLPKARQADILALRGVAALSLGHDQEANELIDTALAKDAASVEANIAAARMALKDRNLDRAQTYLDAALRKDTNNINAWLVAGEIARVRGNYADAVASFERVLKRRPENTLGRLGLAAVYLDRGELERAKKHLNVVLRDWPNHPIGNYLRGELAYRSGNREEARSALRLALAVMPGHLPSHMLLGGIEFADGQIESAASHLTRFVNARPDQLAARKLLAASYLKLDQPKKTLETLSPVLAQIKPDAQVHTLLGAAYMRMGDPSKAAEHYEKAIALDPSATAARMELFVSLLLSDTPGAAGQELSETIELGSTPEQVLAMRTQLLLTKKAYDEALQQAKQLQKQAPDNPTGYNLAGVAYLGKSMTAQAEQEFRQALKVSPDFTLAAMNLATLAMQSTDLQRAKSLYEQVLKSSPTHVGALLGLAEIARRHNEEDEMVRRLEQARQASASALEPRMRLYEHRLEAGNFPAALDLAQEMEAAHSGDPDVLRALGIAQQGSRLIKRAVETFKRLVDLQPDSAQAHALYADALASYGDVAAAREQLNEALRLDPDFLNARLGLGALEARAGNRERALEIARAIQGRHGKQAAGYELEGDIHMAAGEGAEAARAFRQAYDRAPGARLAQKEFNAWRTAQQAPASYDALRRWLRKQPHDVDTRVLLAKAYQLDGQPDAAAKEYQAVLSQAPDRADVMNNLAWIFLGSDPGQALKWAEKAYNLSPQNPAIVDTYGWALFQHGDQSTGLGLLQEALLKAPQDSGIRFHVAQALESVGNREEAHRHVKQVLLTDPDFAEKDAAQAMLKRLEGR